MSGPRATAVATLDQRLAALESGVDTYIAQLDQVLTIDHQLRDRQRQLYDAAPAQHPTPTCRRLSNMSTFDFWNGHHNASSLLFAEDGTVRLPKLIGIAISMATKSHGCLTRQPTRARPRLSATLLPIASQPGDSPWRSDPTSRATPSGCTCCPTPAHESADAMDNPMKAFGMSVTQALRGQQIRPAAVGAKLKDAAAVLDRRLTAAQRTEVEATLAKAGVSAATMPHAVEVVEHVVQRFGADPSRVADFVAEAAAIGQLGGPQILFVRHLAETALRM